MSGKISSTTTKIEDKSLSDDISEGQKTQQAAAGNRRSYPPQAAQRPVDIEQRNAVLIEMSNQIHNKKLIGTNFKEVILPKTNVKQPGWLQAGKRAIASPYSHRAILKERHVTDADVQSEGYLDKIKAKFERPGLLKSLGKSLTGSLKEMAYGTLGSVTKDAQRKELTDKLRDNPFYLRLLHLREHQPRGEIIEIKKLKEQNEIRELFSEHKILDSDLVFQTESSEYFITQGDSLYFLAKIGEDEENQKFQMINLTQENEKLLLEDSILDQLKNNPETQDELKVELEIYAQLQTNHNQIRAELASDKATKNPSYKAALEQALTEVLDEGRIHDHIIQSLTQNLQEPAEPGVSEEEEPPPIEEAPPVVSKKSREEVLRSLSQSSRELYLPEEFEELSDEFATQHKAQKQLKKKERDPLSTKTFVSDKKLSDAEITEILKGLDSLGNKQGRNASEKKIPIKPEVAQRINAGFLEIALLKKKEAGLKKVEENAPRRQTLTREESLIQSRRQALKDSSSEDESSMSLSKEEKVMPQKTAPTKPAEQPKAPQQLGSNRKVTLKTAARTETSQADLLASIRGAKGQEKKSVEPEKKMPEPVKKKSNETTNLFTSSKLLDQVKKSKKGGGGSSSGSSSSSEWD